ncbi:MAG: diguanylate cyclase [Pseudomonadota bacterium]
MNTVLRLLLVEDAPRDARVLREMLADVDGMPPPELHHVTTLALAEQALASNTYDCILLDLRLPDGEGVASVDRIREHHREVTLVVLTGNSDQQAALTALQHGAQDYVIKGTLDGDALMRLLRHAVERNRLVIQIERSRQQEYHRATHDPLTGLPNRPLFADRVATALAQRHSRSMAVCFVDLDGFKHVNDLHGHATGDRLLKAVAATLQDTVRGGDTIARVGGDEFAVLLTQPRDADEAARVAQRMVQRVAALTKIDGQAIEIGASIGIALHPQHGVDCEQLLASADRAMYRAKGAGKGQWRFFTEPEDQPVSLALPCFDLGALQLRYQPWYDNQSRSCLGLEALIRHQGHTAADTVVQQAQAQRALPQLGSWVLQQACRNWLALAASHSAPPKLAINICASELENRDYADLTLRLLADLGMPCKALQVEVAEDDLAEGPESPALLCNLKVLRSQGIRIALDRFGRKQGSLSRLASLPMDVVKLDVRHVRELRTQPLVRAFLSSVMGYAKALGRDTVLCGIETAADLDNLLSLAPQGVQGFGLALPLGHGRVQPCPLPC